MKLGRLCFAMLLIANSFLLPPVLPAAMLGNDMSIFSGTLEKITETSESYIIKIGEKKFVLPKEKNHQLLNNTRLMIGKKVTVTYQSKDFKIQSIKKYKAPTPK